MNTECKHDCYHVDWDGECLLDIDDKESCQCYEPYHPWEDNYEED